MNSIDITGAVAVVTGGAGGIGKGIVRALLARGATVVIADIEPSAVEGAVAELRAIGPVEGVVTNVMDEASVGALADHVYATHGRCNLLFNNAGVGSGGGGKAWESEPNDWRWCFGVNVFGAAIGVHTFVPRMLESGEPGHVVNTSSGDGGIAPVPMAAVYASSKAALSCFTEALYHQLQAVSDQVSASVFYPSGGLMNTGLFNSQRNRPTELARVNDAPGRGPMSFEEMKGYMEAAGHDVKVADLEALGEFVVDCVAERRYVIARDLSESVDLLHRRADAIGRFEAPPHHEMGLPMTGRRSS